MKALYDQFSYDSSKKITHVYSTSFTLGIKMLDKKFHNAIYGIYGLVRLADEIVDSFHDYDKKKLLAEFKASTYQAIEEKISLNPIIHSFQEIVNQYEIEEELIEAFFKSMEMDLYQIEYDSENYNEYIYGSAEVVGLMCLRVFTENDKKLYDSLKAGAKSLGAAFQKVNFLRDMQADFEERGRTYFPTVNFLNFTEEDKAAIEKDIENDFDNALNAILNLPFSSKVGVYLAYNYYLSLYDKIKKAKASDILKKRFRVPDFKKVIILSEVYMKGQLGVI